MARRASHLNGIPIVTPLKTLANGQDGGDVEGEPTVDVAGHTGGTSRESLPVSPLEV